MAEPLPWANWRLDLLERCPALRPTEAADVVLGPSLGEDAAVVMTGEPCPVLKSDPITFATDRLGWCAVHVAANDVATRGVDPRWMLFTLLLPPGSTDEQASRCSPRSAMPGQGIGLVLVGGHSEVTSAVTRPVVSTSPRLRCRRAGRCNAAPTARRRHPHGRRVPRRGWGRGGAGVRPSAPGGGGAGGDSVQGRLCPRRPGDLRPARSPGAAGSRGCMLSTTPQRE